MSDALPICALTRELGYECEEATIRSRLHGLTEQPEQMLLVACSGQQILGWIQAGVTDYLESGRRAEIFGLVVTESQRRRGIGRLLVKAVEEWAITLGLNTMVVRMNVKRTQSHQFYTQMGFREAKVQTVFRKALVQGESEE